MKLQSQAMAAAALLVIAASAAMLMFAGIRFQVAEFHVPAASAEQQQLAALSAKSDLVADLSTKDRLWFLKHLPEMCLRHEIPAQQRTSSSPFISGDGFRSMADHLFDETTNPPGAAWRPDNVKQGDIIFVNTDFTDDFFKLRAPGIKHTYILVTHNSDYSAPYDPRKYDSQAYLSNSTLGHWYGQNMLMQHPKLTPIPIGIANCMWPHGKKEVIGEVALKAPAWHTRITAVYMNASPGTNAQRARIIELFKGIPGSKVVTERISWRQYLEDMGNSKFVVSPPGNGVDTHRAWEAIQLGAVPIVLAGPLDPLFEGMPVMVVQDYENVTHSMLESFAASMEQQHRSTQKAWMLYWHQQFQHKKEEIKKQNK